MHESPCIPHPLEEWGDAGGAATALLHCTVQRSRAARDFGIRQGPVLTSAGRHTPGARPNLWAPMRGLSYSHCAVPFRGRAAGTSKLTCSQTELASELLVRACIKR